jgi:mannosyl-3-phosphoglycerate phosphatase
MQPVPPIVVLCDLDDTLFEPHAFALDASTHGAFGPIERKHLPVVFCSSKTRAELELIQHELGVNQPFICESGAAVLVPQGYFGFSVEPAREVAGYDVVEFGKSYAEIVNLLHRAAERLGIEVVGFSDMSVEAVAIECDVPLLQARLAKLREYSELFRVIDAKPGVIPRTVKALRAAGLDCTTRRRYHQVGALRRDTGGQFLLGLYRRAYGEVVTVAFGDHESAASLLRHADIPLVLQSDAPDQTAQLLRGVPGARISIADSIGAWAERILEIAHAVQRRRSSCLS